MLIAGHEQASDSDSDQSDQSDESESKTSESDEEEDNADTPVRRRSPRRRSQGRDAVNLLSTLLQQVVDRNKDNRPGRRGRGRKSKVNKEVEAMRQAETPGVRNIFLVRTQ